MTLDSFQAIALMAASLQGSYSNEESAIKAAVRMYNSCKNRIDYKDGEYYLRSKDAPKDENSKEGMVTWGNEEKKSEIKTAEEVVIENRKKRRKSWDDDDYDY